MDVVESDAKPPNEQSDGIEDDFMDHGITISINETVGNMSISPGNRDLALATRKGLYIVDLEHHRETPRFLPQGGSWEIADVQWNPHPSSSELIVSTSSQKLLIWNLKMRGPTSIQHILHAHYRAITDINWHSHFDNIVASCSIDSWIWIWDLREPTRKNVMGLCAWNEAATQVKWNRRDPHILASSHLGSVLIWDDRKGALPLATIRAHDAKVYGIDWSRTSADELVTCSLDNTIKRWDINAFQSVSDNTFSSLSTPVDTIHTAYPVWRARHLPFGNGVLSLPQRGDHALEMYNLERTEEPIASFHRGSLVKEYVWRTRGGSDLSFDDREFQLVTLATDRTVKLESITPVVQESAGFVRGTPIKTYMPRHGAPNITYRTLPEETDSSVVTDDRSISRSTSQGTSSPVKRRVIEENPSDVVLNSDTRPPPITGSSGAFMTLPPHRGRLRRGELDQIAWFSSVKRDKNNGAPYSQDNSNVPSRAESRTRVTTPARRTRSPSGSQDVPAAQADLPEDLADEVSIVVQKLAGKVQHEKTETSKRKMMCSFTLYGPWGESGSTFLRVIFFNFPKEYPRASPAISKPSVEIEKGTSIPLKTRAILLRGLRRILSSHAPALELCLLFLLGLYKRPRLPDSDTEDEIAPVGLIGDNPAPVLLNNQSLPRPRHTQAVFGPNGSLVCVFQSRASKVASARGAGSPTRSLVSKTSLEFHRSPSGTLLDAMWGLSKLSTDGPFVSRDYVNTGRRRRANFTDALVMRPAPRSRTRDAKPNISHQRSSVYIKDFTHFDVLDEALGAEYPVSAKDPISFCQENARVALAHARADHARVWDMLHSLLVPVLRKSVDHREQSDTRVSLSTVLPDVSPALQKDFHAVFRMIYDDYAFQKDLQMLAMLGVLFLNVDALLPIRRPRPSIATSTPAKTPVLRLSIDYFSLRPGARGVHSPATVPPSSTTGQSTPRLPVPATASPASSGPSMSSSSKASWTSILSAANYRNLLGGSSSSDNNTPSRREKMATDPARLTPAIDTVGELSPSGGLASAVADLKRRRSLVPAMPIPVPAETVPSAKSRAETFPVRINANPTVQQYRRRLPSVSQYSIPRKDALKPARITVGLHVPVSIPAILIDSGLRLQCEGHIRAYADVLFRWGFTTKRAELLRNTRVWEADREPVLSIVPLCRICHKEAHPRGSECSVTKSKGKSPDPPCSICRHPVRALGRACLRCLHVTHISCWKRLPLNYQTSCASGCGCKCSVLSGMFEMGKESQSVLAVRHPPPNLAVEPDPTPSRRRSERSFRRSRIER